MRSCLRHVNLKKKQVQEDSKAVCFHKALFNKTERRHRMTKCKANFCKL